MERLGKNNVGIIKNLNHHGIVFFCSEVLRAETIAKEKKDNPANFGVGCDRHCICELLGQVPCPGTCPLPKQWRGKYLYQKKED